MLFLLFLCCLCCCLLVVGEQGAEILFYFSLPSRMGFLCPHSPVTSKTFIAKNGVNIGWNHARSSAKPCKKWCESMEKVISHRPLWTWATVGVRWLVAVFCPISSWVSPDFFVDFAQWLQCFYLKYSYVLCRKFICIARLCGGMCYTPCLLVN